MTSSYDWSTFVLHMYYRAPIERVFAAWSTPAGLESFFIGTATHTGSDGVERGKDDLVRAGDRYSWSYLHPFEGEGEFLECTAPKSVEFTFGKTMRVRAECREVDDQVEVRLTQSGCGDQEWSHLNCRSCWVYFMTNLKSVLEHGTDLRDHERPDLNDSVSIGWAGQGATS